MTNLTKTFKKIGDALQKITDNPDGGKLTVKDGSGRDIVFTMPPKKDRKPLGLPKI